jgi:hypothetical protein
MGVEFGISASVGSAMHAAKESCSYLSARNNRRFDVPHEIFTGKLDLLNRSDRRDSALNNYRIEKITYNESVSYCTGGNMKGRSFFAGRDRGTLNMKYTVRWLLSELSSRVAYRLRIRRNFGELIEANVFERISSVRGGGDVPLRK